MTPSLAEFEAALDRLSIVWRRGSEPTIGPLDNPVTEAVAAWVEAVLYANPALVVAVHQRFAQLQEVAPGVLVLPIASLRTALLTTVEHGEFVGMGVSA